MTSQTTTTSSSSSTIKQSPFETSILDQVRLNLIHYNYWNNVTVYKHDDLEFLSGYPPEPLIPSDNINITPATPILKSLNNPKQIEIDNKDDKIENINQLQLETDIEWIIPRRLIHHQTQTQTQTQLQNQNQNQDQLKLTVGEINHWFKIIKTIIGYRPKRIIIAIINDDGTIVYYFIHDGITKPRQN